MRISIYLYIYIFPAVAASERGRSFDRIHWDDKIQPKATDKQEKTTHSCVDLRIISNAQENVSFTHLVTKHVYNWITNALEEKTIVNFQSIQKKINQ